MSEAVDQYIKTHSKSNGVGFLLTVLFGPLGLFYSNWIAALILCVIAFTTAVSIIGPIACWLLSMSLTFLFVSQHNEKVKAAANLSHANS